MKPITPLPYISVWLIPNNDVLKIVQPMIDELAQINSTQTFIPHVTLLSGFAPASRVNLYQQVFTARNILKDTLHGHFNHFFTGNGTVYHHTLGYWLKFNRASHQVLQAACDHAQEEIQLIPVDAYHMSLLYDSCAPDFKSIDIIKAALKVLPAKFYFNQILIVSGSRAIECPEDVAEWTIVDQFLY